MSVLLIVAAGVFVLTMLRNWRVYRNRMAMLDRISAEASRRIDRYEFSTWRDLYALLDDVSYYRMVFAFWRPLDSFYPRELRDLPR